MKKRILALALALALAFMLALPAAAYTQAQLNTADALYQLGLFLGTGTTYALDDNLTREQGIILLVRMLGAEQTAKDGTWQTPFTDVSDWAAPYVGYAYTNKITNGTSATTFSGTAAMTDQMFLTLCLRAVGYSNENDADFSYNNVWAKAFALGLISSEQHDSNFTRGEVVEIFWKLLKLNLKDGSMTLADKLMQQKVFTKDAWDRANGVQVEGRGLNDGTGETEPRTTPTDPQTPQTPEQPGSGEDDKGSSNPFTLPEISIFG